MKQDVIAILYLITFWGWIPAAIIGAFRHGLGKKNAMTWMLVAFIWFLVVIGLGFLAEAVRY